MNKEARYLIRLAQTGCQPADALTLLESARRRLGPLSAKAINLRVSSTAMEFDLFVPAENSPTAYLSTLESMGRVLTCKRLDVPAEPPQPDRLVAEARGLFNEERYWEVHEVLEGLWKPARGLEKQHLQGIILAAAALVHAQKNETAVVRPMLEDADQRLADPLAPLHGWDLSAFRDDIRRVLTSGEIKFARV